MIDATVLISCSNDILIKSVRFKLRLGAKGWERVVKLALVPTT